MIKLQYKFNHFFLNNTSVYGDNLNLINHKFDVIQESVPHEQQRYPSYHHQMMAPLLRNGENGFYSKCFSKNIWSCHFFSVLLTIHSINKTTH